MNSGLLSTYDYPKAIKWATSEGVVSDWLCVSRSVRAIANFLVPKVKDIILMPWSIEATADENSDELKNLKLALFAAATNNIILFCAISDKGEATADNLYPGCVPMVLRIGAATSTGEVPAIVLSRKVQFIFPGEVSGEKNSADGSSVATALAAGVAAMLLHCSDKVMPEAVHHEYHKRAVIVQAFRKMGGTPTSAIRVQEYFGDEDETE